MSAGHPEGAGYLPFRCRMSGRFNPAARTRTRICSAPGDGVGTSPSCNTLTSPHVGWRIALIPHGSESREAGVKGGSARRLLPPRGERGHAIRLGTRHPASRRREMVVTPGWATRLLRISIGGGDESTFL